MNLDENARNCINLKSKINSFIDWHSGSVRESSGQRSLSVSGRVQDHGDADHLVSHCGQDMVNIES